MSKEATVFVLDVGVQMESLPGALDEAKRIMRYALQKKMLYKGAGDVFSIVLVGASSSNSPLNYEGVWIVTALSTPSQALLRAVGQLVPSGGSGCLVDGLIAALQMLDEHCGTKKYTKKVFILTSHLSTANASQLDAVCAKAASMEVQLHVAGAGFGGTLPSPIEHLFAGLAAQLPGSSCMSLDDMLSQAAERSGKRTLQRPAYSGALTLGPGLAVPVVCFIKSARQPAPRLAKLVKDAPEATVARQVSYMPVADDRQVLPADQTIKAHRYGASLVPLASEEELKPSESRSMTVLGFASAKCVPREHLLTRSMVVVGKQDCEQAVAAMAALAQALIELDEVAIVRFVRAERAEPVLGALVPAFDPNDNHTGLYFAQIPFLEDVRYYAFPSLRSRPHWVPSDTQVAAAGALVDALALADDELVPERTPNAVFQHILDALHYRAEHPVDPLPPMAQPLADTLNPSRFALRALAQLEAFKAALPLRVVEKEATATRKFKRRFWRVTSDAAEAGSAADGAGGATAQGPAPKRARIEAEAAASARPNAPHAIGTVNPTADFRAMVSSKTEDLVAQAMDMLARVIDGLVADSIHGSHHAKALEALRAMRETAVKQAEAQRFNAYLSSVRERFGTGRCADFWRRLVSEGITLVSSAESEDSSVSADQAVAFLHGLAADVVVVAKPAGDDDALFDQLL